MAPSAPPPRRFEPALVVIMAGVCAALHVGKLPPAIGALREATGMTLVEAGFLLSMVQLAGMSLGLAFGLLAERLGGRRSMITGLLVLAGASAAGGVAPGMPALMVLRALEGFGFLLVVLPAPGMVQLLVAPARKSLMMGLWGAYMPLATALALLLGPMFIAGFGWRAWWWALAAVSLAMSGVLASGLPAAPLRAVRAAAWWAPMRQTLVAPGPWLVALSFAMYSGQWLSVIGFLPTIYSQAGFGAAATGVLTAAAAAANMLGNIASGRLLQRGMKAPTLLAVGYTMMGLAALVTFGAESLPAAARYAAVLAFSGFGGLIPATLFALAVRLAPGEGTLFPTMGWVQQWSSLGQFLGPPLVAAVASAAGGWQRTGFATGACALAGLGLTALLARRLRV